MVSARRIVVVAKNDVKRIVRYNHLPQKRRLLEVVEEWKIKRTKLNKDLRIQMNEYSNEYLFATNAFWSVLSILKKLKFPQKFCRSLVRAKSCPHVNRTRHRTPHRTIPAPAQRCLGAVSQSSPDLIFWAGTSGTKAPTQFFYPSTNEPNLFFNSSSDRPQEDTVFFPSEEKWLHLLRPYR